MRVYKIETNGTCGFIDIEDGLDSFQAEVGGYIQGLYLSDGTTCYIDEEGKLKGLAPNPVATRFAEKYIGLLPGDYIAGPMIVLGPCDEEGYDTPCPDEVERLVQKANA